MMAVVDVRGSAAVEPAAEPPLSVVIGLEGLALGGCPINALDLGRALRRRGHRVSVFAIDEDVRVSLLPYAERCGLTVYRFPSATGIVPLSRRIRELVERESADVVHVFAPWLGPAATVAAAASRRHRSAVVTNWMMENVDYTPRRTPLILGTRALQREAQAGHGGRVWLMEPPVDIELDRPDQELGRRFRREIGVGDDEIAAVIVSRLDLDLKAEGIGHALRAVGRLALPGLRLVVVGDGDAADPLRREADQVNRALDRPAVVFTGARHDPRPAYAAADIALGMGGSALRALAHGTPLIVLGMHGFARTFEPAALDHFYDRGFFGDEPQPDPVGHLADLLRAMLAEDRRRELGRFGLAEVRARFGLAVTTARLENIYRASLAATPGRAARLATGAYVLGRGLGHEARRAVRCGQRA
jgi:glycosyltransferase involved in cell wall biosynthesis